MALAREGNPGCLTPVLYCWGIRPVFISQALWVVDKIPARIDTVPLVRLNFR